MTRTNYPTYILRGIRRVLAEIGSGRKSLPLVARTAVMLLVRRGPRAVFDVLMIQSQNRPQIYDALPHLEMESAAEHEALAVKVAALGDLPGTTVIVLVDGQADGELHSSLTSISRQKFISPQVVVLRRLDARTWTASTSAPGSPFIASPLDARTETLGDALRQLDSSITSEIVSIVRAGDRLESTTIAEVAAAFATSADAKIVYSDEDSVADAGFLFSPHFKPDFSPYLLLSRNYFGGLTAYRAAALRAAGGWNSSLDGAAEYDLNLRLAVGASAREIIHLPRVLYHRRHDDEVPVGQERRIDEQFHAELAVLQAHLEATQPGSSASPATGAPFFSTVHSLPAQVPSVTLIIPTRDRADLLRTCVRSIIEKTDYTNYDIIIVDNDSREESTLALFAELSASGRVRVIQYPGVFNYSQISNFAVAQATGDIVGLINNDIEVITPNWLTEMVSLAAKDDVGCVGARLFYPDDTVQHGGVIVGTGGLAAHRFRSFGRNHPGYFSQLRLRQDMSAVTGACLLVRKSVYLAAGGLDEANLPVAFNDVDFCLNVQKAGYRNVWSPAAELYHHESVSRGADNTPEKLARATAEATHFRRKWRGFVDPYYSPHLPLDRDDYGLSMGSDTRLRIGIAAIVRNEGPYLLEWLAFHRVVGVNRFFLTDDNSDDGTSELLSALARAGVIDVAPGPRSTDRPRQLEAYGLMASRYGAEVDWLAFLDADEFAAPLGNVSSLREVIASFDRVEHIGAIALNWAIFGSSHLETGDDQRPVVERFTMRSERAFDVNHHYKSIVRTRAFLSTHGNPHLFRLRPGFSLVHPDGAAVIDHPTFGPGLSREVAWRRLRLNHYIVKSKEEYWTRKALRGDATRAGYTPKGEEYFLGHDRNEVTDEIAPWLIEATKQEMAALRSRIS